MGVNAAPDLGVKDEAECVNDVVAVTASAKDGVVRVVRVIGEAEKGVEELADGGATTDFADERVEHVRGEAEESAGKGLNVVKIVAGGGEGGVAGTGSADDVEVDVDLGGGGVGGQGVGGGGDEALDDGVGGAVPVGVGGATECERVGGAGVVRVDKEAVD
jgi:hypothetical protein